MKKKKVKLFIAIMVWILGVPLTSWAIEGFPGSVWGIGIYESLEQNPKTLGSLRQGIDWFKLYQLKFSTYGQFRYRFESQEAEFFNAYGPSLGASVSYKSLRLGWEYEWERFPRIDKTQGKSQFFFEWWYGWDLKKLKR